MSTLSQFFITPPINFATQTPDGRCCVEGGWYIARGNSIAWIVAPNQAEVSRTWYCRNDANTIANACTGCTGWFVPTLTQLLNPGYAYRDYWDTYSTNYWNSTESNATFACYVRFNTGCTTFGCKTNTNCVRSFRCVTY